MIIDNSDFFEQFLREENTISIEDFIMTHKKKYVWANEAIMMACSLVMRRSITTISVSNFDNKISSSVLDFNLTKNDIYKPLLLGFNNAHFVSICQRNNIIQNSPWDSRKINYYGKWWYQN